MLLCTQTLWHETKSFYYIYISFFDIVVLVVDDVFYPVDTDVLLLLLLLVLLLFLMSQHSLKSSKTNELLKRWIDCDDQLSNINSNSDRLKIKEANLLARLQPRARVRGRCDRAPTCNDRIKQGSKLLTLLDHTRWKSQHSEPSSLCWSYEF